MFLAQLTVANRHSPVVGRAGHTPHGALRPGEHLDDLVELTDPAGTPVLLEEILRDRPGHLLLTRITDDDGLGRLRTALGDLGAVVPVVTRGDDAAPDALVDVTGALASGYGLGDDGLVLIRPDGHLGYVSGSSDSPALPEYLDGAGPTGRTSASFVRGTDTSGAA